MPPPSSLLTVPDGTRQHYVPQHFDAQGQYIPPHYAAPKKPVFRGYFDAPNQGGAQAGQGNQAIGAQGYQEPAPDYTTPYDPNGPGKPVEGR